MFSITPLSLRQAPGKLRALVSVVLPQPTMAGVEERKAGR